MTYRLRFACWVLGSLACALVAGCTPGGIPKEGPVVIVTGKLTDNGKLLEVKPGGSVEVVFTGYVEPGKPPDAGRRFTAQADADGNFKLMGRFGKGIPVGKYRVGVHQWERTQRKPGVPGPASPRGNDLLKGKFEDNTSPIALDITEKSGTVEIDVSKPQG